MPLGLVRWNRADLAAHWFGEEDFMKKRTRSMHHLTPRELLETILYSFTSPFATDHAFLTQW